MSTSNKIRPTNGQLPISMTLRLPNQQTTKQKPNIYISNYHRLARIPATNSDV